MKKNAPPSTGELETAITAHADIVYVLRLYTTGSSSRSARAVSNLRKICEEHLAGRYDLEVVDISQYPMLAKSEQILAVPTLIKKLPLPVRRFVGDMSQSERFFLGLHLHEVTEKAQVASVAAPHAE